MAECNFHNIYQNLSTTPSNDQQSRQKKKMKLKIILLLRLKKEN